MVIRWYSDYTDGTGNLSRPTWIALDHQTFAPRRNTGEHAIVAVGEGMTVSAAAVFLGSSSGGSDSAIWSPSPNFNSLPYTKL
jgi:hypothetical protein